MIPKYGSEMIERATDFVASSEGCGGSCTLSTAAASTGGQEE